MDKDFVGFLEREKCKQKLHLISSFKSKGSNLYKVSRLCIVGASSSLETATELQEKNNQ